MDVTIVNKNNEIGQNQVSTIIVPIEDHSKNRAIFVQK